MILTSAYQISLIPSFSYAQDRLLRRRDNQSCGAFICGERGLSPPAEMDSRSEPGMTRETGEGRECGFRHSGIPLILTFSHRGRRDEVRNDTVGDSLPCMKAGRPRAGTPALPQVN